MTQSGPSVHCNAKQGADRVTAICGQYTVTQSKGQIALVVDLTYTDKYYNGTREFVAHGVDYLKVVL